MGHSHRTSFTELYLSSNQSVSYNSRPPHSGLRWGHFRRRQHGSKWFFSCSYICFELEKICFRFFLFYGGPEKWKLCRKSFFSTAKMKKMKMHIFTSFFNKNNLLKGLNCWYFSVIVAEINRKSIQSKMYCLNEFYALKYVNFSHFFYHFWNYSWLLASAIYFFAFVQYPGCGQQFKLVAKFGGPL